ncbi:MAG: DUF937 domain-containing protein [Pseudomonadota bacterium]
MDQLTQVVASQMAQSAAQKTGLSEGMVAKLAPMAMGAIMNGLKTNASNPQGAQALASALDRHDGGLLNNIGNLANDDTMADGQKILGHVFGGRQAVAEQELAKAAGGLDQGQVNALLAMAAPAVLGALGRAKREQNLDVSALAGLVTEEGQRAQKAAPAEMSGFMKMLDSDGDGNLNNEAMGIGKKLLGGLFGKR